MALYSILATISMVLADFDIVEFNIADDFYTNNEEFLNRDRPRNYDDQDAIFDFFGL